ncbi:MAG: glycosyltransferase [Omnitrophica bacterium RIFCSPLOWO2_12_FULL_50_11]|nr:MAG: glycosyltransferase [Omnitrophica bacterium RIFCSPLOWO2_12_FULL_50_11]
MSVFDQPAQASGSIGVVIVNWNSWGVLSRCLEALQGQTFRDFKVLVIDNASTNPAPDGFFLHHRNIKFVLNQGNLGFAAANNQAMKLLGDFEWLALLNPDAFPEPDWLERLVDAARKNPDYTVFASRQLMDGDRDLLDGDGDAYHISGLVWREGHGKRKDETADEPQEIFSPCAAAALYRRDMLMTVGGFDEDFFCYVEDVDLGFRLRLMGHRCLLVPGAVVYHIGSATTGGQQSDFAVYHGHRNLVWAYVKNMPGYLFWACLPLHIAMNLAAVCVFVLRGKGGVILRAKRDALLGLPKMWRKRQNIQRRRSVYVVDIWRVLDKRMYRG